MNWELHSAAGFWTAAFVAMWALTGIYFAFPSAFRSAVHAVSPLTDERAPVSDVTMRHRQPPPTWRALIEIAKREVPSRPVARVILPAHDRAAFQVGFVDRLPMPAGTADVETVYLDQYTGAVLAPPGPVRRSVGDIVMAWVAPLHVGSFGGMPVKVLWLLLGLAPPLLFVTGAVMWWNRVLRERRGRWFAPSRARAQRSAHDPMPRART